MIIIFFLKFKTFKFGQLGGKIFTQKKKARVFFYGPLFFFLNPICWIFQKKTKNGVLEHFFFKTLFGKI